MTIEENVPLAPLTTFRIGGRARFLVRAQTLDDIREAIAFAREKELPIFVLGGGSNTLVDDAGFRGVVFKIEMKGIVWEYLDDAHELMIASAGEWWDDIVAESTRRDLYGLESLSGIPGTAGAAPVQNIGAYGADVATTIVWVEVLNTEHGIVERLSRDVCAFGYRTSRFKSEPGKYIILRVAFKLSLCGVPNISYKDVCEAFTEKEGTPTPQEIREKILMIRAGKFPDLAREGTAGSFFLNPIVSIEDAVRIADLLPGLPQFPQSDGRIKLSLAYMLDKGLGLKGFSVGDARLFEKQPLVLVSHFGAPASDVYALRDTICKKVFDAYGIEIEPEVRVLRDL